MFGGVFFVLLFLPGCFIICLRHVWRLTFLGDVMADNAQKNVSLSSVERVMVQVALRQAVKSIERARTKEVVGSEIYEMRGRQMQQIQDLINRFN